VTDRPARRALVAALSAPRRHLLAGGLVGAALWVGHGIVGTPEARYGAALAAFAVWMWWFVATAVAWLGEAEF
jgi:hypothetical protein